MQIPENKVMSWLDTQARLFDSDIDKEDVPLGIVEMGYGRLENMMKIHALLTQMNYNASILERISNEISRQQMGIVHHTHLYF